MESDSTVRGEVPETAMMSMDRARSALRARIVPLRPRSELLTDSIGATLAESVIAATAIPRADTAAMDGYAVAGDGPWRLRGDGQYAGGDVVQALMAGDAVRIATGAVVPVGTSVVLRDEVVEVVRGDRAQTVVLGEGARLRDDTRRRGECWDTGYEVAAAGSPVTCAVISAALSGEVHEATVRGPVRARVVITGDEICTAGPLAAGQTRDCLGPVLPRYLSAAGAACTEVVHACDRADAFTTVLSDDAACDLVVVVGATGHGAADQLRGALARVGADIIVSRVACRPGGSVVIAQLGDGRVVLGLPGNPLAAVAVVMTMTAAIVDGLTAHSLRPPLAGRLVPDFAAIGDTTRIVPAVRSSDGRWQVRTGVHTSHLAGLIGCDAFAVIPRGYRDGQLVELVQLPV